MKYFYLIISLIGFSFCFGQDMSPRELQSGRELMISTYGGINHEKGNKINDIKEGEWVGYSSEGTILYKESYKNGLVEVYQRGEVYPCNLFLRLLILKNFNQQDKSKTKNILL